jgi:hypothetical protein
MSPLSIPGRVRTLIFTGGCNSSVIYAAMDFTDRMCFCLEQCPRCQRWTLEVSISQTMLRCCDERCRYEMKIDVDRYLSERSEKYVLPLIAKSLVLAA